MKKTTKEEFDYLLFKFKSEVSAKPVFEDKFFSMHLSPFIFISLVNPLNSILNSRMDLTGRIPDDQNKEKVISLCFKYLQLEVETTLGKLDRQNLLERYRSKMNKKYKIEVFDEKLKNFVAFYEPSAAFLVTEGKVEIQTFEKDGPTSDKPSVFKNVLIFTYREINEKSKIIMKIFKQDHNGIIVFDDKTSDNLNSSNQVTLTRDLVQILDGVNLEGNLREKYNINFS
jgi:hypothetical protein